MKSPFSMKTALQKVAGHLSETLAPPIKDGEKSKVPATHIIKHFLSIIDILEKENTHLSEHNYLKAMEFFPKKQSLITALHDIIHEGKVKGVRSTEALTAQLKEVETHFQQAAEKNQHLLKKAITTQENVMKILVEGAIENNRHGYNRAGTMGSDTSRAAFSLNNQI